jgi:S1/P1 Nuclease
LAACKLSIRYVGKPASKTLSAVHNVLGSSESLASISSWTDDYKYMPAGIHAQPWHHVDIDVDHDKYASSDCPAKGCIVSAIEAQAKVLGDKSQPMKDWQFALKMIVHLVDNSTQPFHWSECDHDAGANKVYVDFEGDGPERSNRFVCISSIGLAARDGRNPQTRRFPSDVPTHAKSADGVQRPCVTTNGDFAPPVIHIRLAHPKSCHSPNTGRWHPENDLRL